MADVGENRIILRYDAEGPIDLEKLTDGFNGLARQYRRVVKKQGLKPSDTDARLFLTRIQSGSIEAELAIAAAAFGHSLGFMDGGLILHDFTMRVKNALDFFRGLRLNARPSTSKIVPTSKLLRGLSPKNTTPS